MQLKHRAKRRGKLFLLVRECFHCFAKITGFKNVHTSEYGSEFMTVDRIDSRLGYMSGNIQFLTLSENSAKGNRDQYVPFLRDKQGENPF